MAHKYQTLTTAIKQQYDYSLEMLREITEACPDEIWTKKAGLYPFWQQIYHAIYWTDYNIQESKDGEKIFSWKTEKKITHELNAENNISSEYSELIRNPSRLSRQNREKHGFSPPLRRDGFSLNSLYLTREEIRSYFQAFTKKKDSFFCKIEDSALLAPIPHRQDGCTYLDIITNQIRHIMYHVGHCDCILREHGYSAVAWLSIYGRMER